MTYQQTLDYLFARLPMFQRVGAAAYKANLDNTIKIVELLGKPHQKIKCIHVAGTNGKGSSSHMLAAVLQQAGYKTGLYTSPHLVDFRERIKINGKMIGLVKCVGAVAVAFLFINDGFPAKKAGYCKITFQQVFFTQTLPLLTPFHLLLRSQLLVSEN